MNNKLTIAIALMAGLLGGQLTRFLSPPPAFAQNPAPSVAKEIRAQSFTLVDASDIPIGTFTADAPGFSGQPRSGLPGGRPAPAIRPTRIVLRDVSGGV